MNHSIGRHGRITALTIVALAGVLVALAVAQRIEGPGTARHRLVRRALSQSIGFASLAVAADCTLARSLMEGLSACLGDVAGGYCTYQSCDIMTQPALATFPTAHLHVESVSSNDGHDEAP